MLAFFRYSIEKSKSLIPMGIEAKGLPPMEIELWP